MLIFHRFRGTSAHPFHKFDLDLRRQGLVRMKGVNGAGKSSLWHLLTQCLYGQNPNASKKSDLLLTESDFLLETTFELGGSVYVAAQAHKSKTDAPNGQRYGTGTYLFKDGQDISQHRDPDTLKLIRATIGWSIDEWYGYVYLAQQSTHTLINGTRSERQQYLSTLFNLSGLDRLHAYFKDRVETLEPKVERYRTGQTELTVKNSLLAGRSAVDLDTELGAVDEKLRRVQSDLRDAEQAARLTGDLARLQGQLDATPVGNLKKLRGLLEMEQEQQAERSRVVREVQQAESLLVQAEDRQEPLRLPDDLKAVLGLELPDPAWLQTEISASEALDRATQLPQGFSVPEIPPDLQAVLESPTTDIQKLSGDLLKIRSRPPAPQAVRPTTEQIESIQIKSTQVQQEVQALEKRITKLRFNKSECDQCGTVLDTVHRTDELQQAEQELSDLQETALVLAKKKRDLAAADAAWRQHDALGPDRSAELPELERLSGIEQKRPAYREIEKLSKLQAARQDAEPTIKKLPGLKAQQQQIEQRARYRQIESAQAEQIKIAQLVQELRAKVEKLAQEQQALPDRQDRLTELQRDISTAERRGVIETQMAETQQALKKLPVGQNTVDLSTERSALESRKGQIEQERREIQGLVESIQRLQQEILEGEQAFRTQQMYGILAKGYGRAGQLRERQLAKFSSFLEAALVAYTLKQLPRHRFRIVVDEGIDIECSKEGGRFYDVKFLSGGEKGALSVAFLFALDDLLPPNRRTNLKILDEVESAFDVERQQDFTATTLPRLKDRVETLVVISHSAHADSGVFDRTWEIKDGGIQDATVDARQFELEDV